MRAGCSSLKGCHMKGSYSLGKKFGFTFITEPFEVSWDVVSSLSPEIINDRWKLWRAWGNAICHPSAQIPWL